MIYVYHQLEIQNDRLQSNAVDLKRFCLVGIVDTESIAQAFTWTNHFNTCWCSRREAKAIGTRHRSTQVGDLFRIIGSAGSNDRWFRLEPVGFTELDVHFPGDLRHALMVNHLLEKRESSFNEVEQGWMGAYLQWAGTTQEMLKPA